jgi:hypothetical protein
VGAALEVGGKRECTDHVHPAAQVFAKFGPAAPRPPFSSNSTPFGDLELVRDVKVVIDLDDDPDRPKVVGVQVIGMAFPNLKASRKGVVDGIAIRRFGGKSIDTARASHTGT